MLLTQALTAELKMKPFERRYQHISSIYVRTKEMLGVSRQFQFVILEAYET
jgi:hypothetical protein